MRMDACLWSKLKYNVERYSRTPAAGLVVLGELGEADALTDEETRVVFSAAIEAAAEEKAMVASVGRESVPGDAAVGGVRASAGYDAVAVRGPVFAAEGELRIETETYFRAVADGASVPVVLVSGRGRELSVAAVAALAEHPNVIGLIDGEGARVGDIKAATASVSREVTVTTVFAAATRRMLKSSMAASSANLGGVAVLEAKPGCEDQVKEGWVPDFERFRPRKCWKAGSRAPWERCRV